MTEKGYHNKTYNRIYIDNPQLIVHEDIRVPTLLDINGDVQIYFHSCVFLISHFTRVESSNEGAEGAYEAH